MKKSIKLTALSLLLFSGAFAAVPPAVKDAVPFKNAVSINGLFTKIGVKVSVSENVASKVFVTITNDSKDVLYKGTLTGEKGSSKTYNLASLENGNYNIRISQKHQELTKQIHIYDSNGQKDYFIVQ